MHYQGQYRFTRFPRPTENTNMKTRNVMEQIVRIGDAFADARKVIEGHNMERTMQSVEHIAERVRIACKTRINADATHIMLVEEAPMTAPGAFVLWSRDGRRGPEFGTHFYSLNDGGLHGGHYDIDTHEDAVASICRRARMTHEQVMRRLVPAHPL